MSEGAPIGWDVSARAWIDSLGETGDRGRRWVVDPALKAWLATCDPRPARALDVGCGEGRLCRWLASEGIAATGLDPTAPLIDAARVRDPSGSYVLAGAEAMPLADGQFDLVIACLSLIDIPDWRTAIGEMVRVLEPGGQLLVVNVVGFNSAAASGGWQRGAGGERLGFLLDHYLDERVTVEAWSGIRVHNHHRPLGAYMTAFLGHGLILTRYDEPAPVGAPPDFTEHYRRVPWFDFMVWRKPAGA